MTTIDHGKWKFEKGKKNVYNVTPDVFDTNYVKLFDVSNSMNDIFMQDYRKASIIHKLIRKDLKDELHNEAKFTDLTHKLNNLITKYKATAPELGIAFPLGISVNEVIAHDTANVGDTRYLKTNDIVKIDLGIHINGCIIDSAFTHIVDAEESVVNLYNPLLEASKDATYTGICLSGVDARLYEISEGISEVISSYELEDGTSINPVFGLGGHNILPYKVHGSKLILSVPHKSQKGLKMEENEIYAIETYASTGKGMSKQSKLSQFNHFSLHDKIINEYDKLETRVQNNPLINWAKYQNNALPFTQEWCRHIDNYENYLNMYVAKNAVVAFPPMTDSVGSFTSQFEHTIHIKSNCVEILSLGNDY